MLPIKSTCLAASALTQLAELKVLQHFIRLHSKKKRGRSQVMRSIWFVNPFTSFYVRLYVKNQKNIRFEFYSLRHECTSSPDEFGQKVMILGFTSPRRLFLQRKQYLSHSINANRNALIQLMTQLMFSYEATSNNAELGGHFLSYSKYSASYI